MTNHAESRLDPDEEARKISMENIDGQVYSPEQYYHNPKRQKIITIDLTIRAALEVCTTV